MWVAESPAARIISMIIFKQNCPIVNTRPDVAPSAAPSCPDGWHPGPIMVLSVSVYACSRYGCTLVSLKVFRNLLHCAIINCLFPLLRLFSRMFFFQVAAKRHLSTPFPQRESCMRSRGPAAKGSSRTATATRTNVGGPKTTGGSSTGAAAAITSTMASNSLKPS